MAGPAPARRAMAGFVANCPKCDSTSRDARFESDGNAYRPAALRRRSFQRAPALGAGWDVGRRGVCPTRVVRNQIEACTSPADRGFGLMARGPGRIPCRIATGPGLLTGSRGHPRCRFHPAASCVAASVPGTTPHRAAPALLAASPANRRMPSCFGPGLTRPSAHPIILHADRSSRPRPAREDEGSISWAQDAGISLVKILSEP